MDTTQADSITQRAAGRWPIAQNVFTALRQKARDAGLYETYGTDCIQLTHRASGAVLLRLRANGYIEVPFDSMAQNRALTGKSFQRSIVESLQQAGLHIRDDQAGTWPQIPAPDIDSESRMESVHALLMRLVTRADSVKS